MSVSDEISGIYKDSRGDDSYFVKLNSKGFNFNSVCLDLNSKFVIYDSSKIRIAYDSCKNTADSDYATELTNDTNHYKVVRYTNFCFAYQLIVEVLQTPPPTHPTNLETGGNYFVYYCKTVKKSVSSGLIPVLNRDALDREHLIHITFEIFTRVSSSGSLAKFTSISENHISNLNHHTDKYLQHTYKYCYTRNKVVVPYLTRGQFSILDSSKVRISNVPSVIYYGFVTPKQHDRLDCFFAL